jgi:hypothetical protein
MKKHAKAATFSFLFLLAGFVLSLAAARPTTVATGQSDSPANAAGLSDLVQFTPAEIQALKAGQSVSKLLASGSDHEIAVAGAVWINAPMTEAVQAMKDIEHLEHGNGFQLTKRISNPPRLKDFSALELPEEDVRDLKKCRADECEVKLDENAIDRIQKGVDWSKPTATADLNALVRRLALEYVTAYQRGGNKELAVYRDKKRPAYVAEEFKAMVDEMPVLRQRESALRQYLLEYPSAQLPNATSFLYWHKVSFGLKPTIMINHVVITETPQRALVATKQLYASHYFWASLEMRELTHDPSRGEGFWFVDVSRGRSDSLGGGVKGHAIRGRAETESLKGLNEGMQVTKSSLERKTR